MKPLSKVMKVSASPLMRLAASALGGKKKKSAETMSDASSSTPTAPTPDSASNRVARERELQRRYRGGRASTVLTGGGTLG